jgi:cation diffusion facilitator family transporter
MKVMNQGRNHIDSMKMGGRVALAASLALFLLAVAKFTVGHLFGSAILVADAYHSAVDVVAIFASWFGLRLASGKKTRRFPYGLYRAETLMTLLIGGLITWAGIENLLGGYEALFQRGPKSALPAIPLLVGFLSVVVAYVVAKQEKRAGDSINSQALRANASDAFLDILTSLMVMAGITLDYLRIPYVEGLVVIIIALLIIRLGAKNVWLSVLILMDSNIDPKLQSEIEEAVSALDGVEDVHDVKIRQSGPFTMVECEVAAAPWISLHKAHDLADIVEAAIKERYPRIESVFVHTEPSKGKAPTAIIPVKDMKGLDSAVHGHFGRAPYFIVVRIDSEGLEIEDFYHNEFLDEPEKVHIGVKVARVIIRHGIRLVFTARIGEISFHMLKDQFIDILKVEEDATVQEIVDKYRKGEIESLAVPHPSEESEMERMEGQRAEAGGTATRPEITEG